jgi:drug/metabolite transporter (DMT)-like permease
MSLIGEIAALVTALCFAISALIFGETGRMVGAQVTNRVRLVLALIYVGVLNLILFREPLPFSAGSSHWIWLSLSGVIGFALGDAFLFLSYVAVGSRLGLLLLSSAPVFGSVIAWVFFGETLTVLEILGIMLTLIGIGWVVWSFEEPPDTPRGNMRRGEFFGLLGGLGQAVGLVFSKQGMLGDFDPFRANAIRLLAATLAIWLLTLVGGEAGATMAALRRKPASIRLLALGAFIGPVLGVCASLVAVAHTDIGVASTLMSLSPVIVLPVSYWVFREKIGWNAVAGTLLAFVGVAVLFIA